MRAANGPLNALGMCCVMTMPGASGGSRTSTSRIASVPPVEAPIATTCSVVRKWRGRAARGRIASALSFSVTAMGGAPGAARLARRPASARTRARAAALTLAMIS